MSDELQRFWLSLPYLDTMETTLILKMLTKPDRNEVLSLKCVEWKKKNERKFCSFLHRQTLEEANNNLNDKL